MAFNPPSSGNRPRANIRDPRSRLRKVKILIADPDERGSSITSTLLRGFGFDSIEVVQDGDHLLQALRGGEVDLLISEWNLKQMDGIELIQKIRGEEASGWQRDLSAIILTGKADLESVRTARDAGFTEFVAKPFSAKSLSTRLLQIIDNPRQFVISSKFSGPDRRRRTIEDFSAGLDRRSKVPPTAAPTAGDQAAAKAATAGSQFLADVREGKEKSLMKMVQILPPNRRLSQLIGEDISGADLFTEKMIETAQAEVKKKETEFLEWADNDIRMMEACYTKLKDNHADDESKTKLLAAAYSLKSQAGVFGYDMGTEVSRMLLDYMPPEKLVNDHSIIVLRKFLDTISVVFRLKVKEAGGEIGAALIKGLQILTKKLG